MSHITQAVGKLIKLFTSISLLLCICPGIVSGKEIVVHVAETLLL